ncbi:hypothetical protein CHL78_003115 [Romboutsia weinsteinii]|uniref:Flagellar assembly protein FliH/Type III secretion system HrpE domain-containing protein n=1 Tax=Romboutsia weinsteinii TaxID=2020949 RepID=A0A371J872_9FIRM|nr:FliH/SctL family protein [Romboutsia weinsteinii]RDY28925.1 hypothetical protein CHL78_003115 [Romboutsia weinsteinii]
MSLLYKDRNIIRGKEVDLKGRVSLNTAKIIELDKIESLDDLLIKKDLIEIEINNAKKEHSNIMMRTEQLSTDIIESARKEAIDIEKKAYENGYSQGLKNGYEDGYKEAYETNVEKAKVESASIIEKANEILADSNKEVINLLEDSKKDILSLSIFIAEKVLREKFNDEKSMTHILEDILREYELKNSIVIKINPLYIENLQCEVKKWKKSYSINDNIFVIGDRDIETGNAVIEHNKGRLVVGIDSILNRIKEELL